MNYPKRAKPFWDKRLAVCRAHNLFAGGEQIPHLQTEKNFRPGTRPGRKWIALDLPPVGGKFCQAFGTNKNHKAENRKPVLRLNGRKIDEKSFLSLASIEYPRDVTKVHA